MAFGGPLTVTTPTDTQIVITRQFDAPRHLVFACYTQPALIRRWLNGERRIWPPWPAAAMREARITSSPV